MMLHRAVSRARQRGFGLVEVALALLVGIAVVSAALMGVQQNTQRAEAVELATEEQLVFTAADKYYRSTCLSGAIPSSVTIPTLLTSGYLTRAPQAIWGASWSVKMTVERYLAHGGLDLARIQVAMNHDWLLRVPHGQKIELERASLNAISLLRGMIPSRMPAVIGPAREFELPSAGVGR